MKRKLSFALVVFALLSLCLSAAFAGCPYNYETICDTCKVKRPITCRAETRDGNVYYGECTYVPNQCSIRGQAWLHHMKCAECGYGGGAYNVGIILYYHTICGHDADVPNKEYSLPVEQF